VTSAPATTLLDAAAAAVQPRLAVIAATHPLTAGAAQFNAAMVGALRERGEVEFLSWRRLYPPLLYRGPATDAASRPPRVEPAEFLLDWADPRTWRAAVRRIEAFGARALVLPWLHPVMAPPYRWLLRHAPAGVARVVVCHNVVPHERVPLGERLTRSVLRHADLLVTHAPQQRAELLALGLGAKPVLESFHPRFVAADLAPEPSPAAVRAERARQGNPELSLLLYGAVRPYKGVDLALEALARVDPALRVRLVVAGRFWSGRADLEALVRRLGLEARVELRDGYVSNEETALLFGACDAALLPYRSASQSGVVALAFAHERPVVATRVGGLPAAVRDGEDGLLCAPDDPAALARAIERAARAHARLREGVRRGQAERSFGRYAELLAEALA
jgi:glycosyltransferase involved in cell wall biosynthesis